MWKLTITNVGHVAVAGLYHTDTVDKVLSLHTAEVVVVDRVELAEADLLRSHTSKPNKKICQKRVIDPLFL